MPRGKKQHGYSAYGFMGEKYWQTADYNSRLFAYYRWKITALALNRFRWVNLPDTCDARYLEQSLFYTGMATIAYPKNQVGVFYSTKATMRGRPTLYGYPSKWTSIGESGWRFNVSPKNGVFIYDNSRRYPMAEMVNIWARELVDIQRTKQVNRFHQKIPIIILGDADQGLDMTNLAKQIGGGEPLIVGTNKFSDIEVKALTSSPAPFIGSELTEAEKAVWQEIYNTLGIPNLTFKTERMIEDEVKTNESPSNIMLLDSLNERRKAVTKLNERFYEATQGAVLAKPIQVVYNTDWESSLYNQVRDINTMIEAGAIEGEVENG